MGVSIACNYVSSCSAEKSVYVLFSEGSIEYFFGPFIVLMLVAPLLMAPQKRKLKSRKKNAEVLGVRVSTELPSAEETKSTVASGTGINVEGERSVTTSGTNPSVEENRPVASTTDSGSFEEGLQGCIGAVLYSSIFIYAAFQIANSVGILRTLIVSVVFSAVFLLIKRRPMTVISVVLIVSLIGASSLGLQLIQKIKTDIEESYESASLASVENCMQNLYFS